VGGGGVGEGEVREAVGVGLWVARRGGDCSLARRGGECSRSGEEAAAVAVGEAEGTGFERIRASGRLPCGPYLARWHVPTK
jgi:hypothetical protein